MLAPVQVRTSLKACGADLSCEGKSMSIHISVIPAVKNAEHVVRACGVLDHEAAKILKQTCLDLLSADPSARVEIDLEEVSYLAAGAVAVLSSVRRLPRVTFRRLSFMAQAMLDELKAA